MEKTNWDVSIFSLNPRYLMCIKCCAGGGTCKNAREAQDALTAVRKTPDIHIKMTTTFDEVGSRTELFDTLTPDERRRDLWVLQRLGLCPGDTRTARDLLFRVDREIPDETVICAAFPESRGVWAPCPDAGKGFYDKGSRLLPLPQQPCQMKVAKDRSVDELMKTDNIIVRAHHLLCMTCFAGRPNPDQPLAEDNLYELWIRLRDEPDLKVTLIEGPGDCCVCPPCHAFLPERGICVAACHLRDRKKDLDTFAILDLSPGDTLRAEDVLRLIRERIPHTSVVCAFDKNTSTEWSSCASALDGAYERGLKSYPY